MKNIILSILLSVLTITAVAQTNFRHLTIDEAVEQAKKENKMVFVDFYTDWCGPCRTMANTVFPQKKVGDYFNANFVCIKLNAEKEGKDAAKTYNVKAYPTFLVLDTEKKVKMDIKGSMGADDFIAKVKSQLNPDLSPERMKERYESGERTPDLIIGGINHGDNSSVNVHYSGTMGVVIEGCLKGIPSIGFSLCNHAADADFSFTLPYVRRITEEVLQHGLPVGICLNVNFPNDSVLKGVRICRQTKGVWINEFQQAVHPRGGHYYWLTGEYRNDEPEAEDSDHWALDHGYVAVTPTKIDVTAYEIFEELSHWNLTV